MRMRWAMPAMLAVAAVVAVGCGGDDDDGGGGGGGSASGETLTVWNNEFQPDRMAATQAILDEFARVQEIRAASEHALEEVAQAHRSLLARLHPEEWPDIQGHVDALGQITGESANEALLDEVFRRFCVGK